MQNPSGTFIVIEGTDGSGKGTQFNLLKARLEAVGHDVAVFDFPRYDKESSYFVRQYLNGGYGKASSISPYTASIFYAIDRYEAASEIRQAMAAGKVVMSNRFVGSNMAHQGAKFSDSAEQRGFFVWEDNLEFELLGIPRPTMNIVLKVPAQIAYDLIGQKKARSYTDKKRDEHEADINHLRQSVETYDLLCQLFPNDFKAVECTADDQMLSIPEINNRIWQMIQPLLPEKPAGKARAMTVKLGEDQIAKSPGKPQGNEQAAKLELDLTQAAITEAMASGLELKVTFNDWAKNDYAYFTPEDLPKKTAAKYQEFMAEFASQHKAMRAKLKKTGANYDTLVAATPMAATLKVEVSAKPSTLVGVIDRLSKSASDPALQLTNALNSQAKKLWPNSFKQPVVAAKGNKPEALSTIIARLTSDHLPKNLDAKVEPVELIDVWPRNEFKALVDAIYSYSNLPRPELEEKIDSWNYQQKSEALESALKAGNAQTLDKFRYQFDITADRELLQEVLASGIGFDVKLQLATPRYGYEVPAAVDSAGIADEYLACFDKSLELFSSLQAAGHEELAPYATLMGHRCRFEIVSSLFSLKQAMPNKHSVEFERLVDNIREKISEHHAIAASVLAKPAKQTAQPEKQPKPAEKKARSHRGGRRRSGRSKKS